MTARAAQAAAQSDPERNQQFRRWPAPATGNAAAPVRAWHADDVAPPMTLARQAAERAWEQVTRRAGE